MERNRGLRVRFEVAYSSVPHDGIGWKKLISKTKDEDVNKIRGSH